MGTPKSTEQPEFDHLLHWVPDVVAAVREYSAAGMPAEAGEAAGGFHNGGWRLDQRYVEILTVVDEHQFRSHCFARAWTALRQSAETAAQLGGGALTFAVNVSDAAATAERLRAEGHQVLEAPVSREDMGGTVGFHEVFVLDGPSWAPFFITYDPPREQFLADVPAGAFDPGDFDLTAILIETPEPGRAASWLADLVRIPAHDNTIALPGTAVQFIPGPADRIVETTLTGPHPCDTTIAGLRFRTAPAEPR
ncbi:VOC family protein [Nocardia mexicana]|uniref:Glyoxalase-like protein n=1 Tax=Nocardia mexicana TaxID=279262 RepID=A0A370GXZ6_9NOCA|nr:VOC family protein [Nocardia mexicana]RDI48538.1 glyoxalase-like protein [Nocardia mexicana]